MYKRHIGQLVTEGLKYFLNWDHYLCTHVLLMMLIIAGFAKLSLNRAAKTVRVGWMLIGHDLRALKADIMNAVATLQRIKHANG